MQTLQFFDWRVTVAPEYGGNLCRLCHGELEMLRTPDTPSQLDRDRVLYGLPVLFPPNRIANGEFEADGRRYVLPVNEPPPRCNHLHGLPVHAVWNASAGMNRVDMNWTYGPGHPAFEGFPCPFRLELVYEFSRGSVQQALTVMNTGESALPCGAGFHSVFKAPKRARVTAAGYYWEIQRPRYLPSGRQLEWEQFDPREWFEPDRYDISWHTPVEDGSYEGRAFRGAVLDYGCKTVLYEVDQNYRCWMLWNRKAQSGFFCPEPMSWMVDAPNLKLPRGITGFRLLPPGGSAVYRTAIRVVRAGGSSGL